MSNLRGKVVTYLGNLAMDYCTTVTVIADYHTIKTNIKQVKKDKLKKVLYVLGKGLDSNINELKESINIIYCINLQKLEKKTI